MKNKTNFSNIKDFINHFLAGLDSRQKEVIKFRYGLNGQEELTLQAIGDKHEITRERVRQIEASAISFLKTIKGEPYLNTFINTSLNFLEKAGGVAKEDTFLSEIQKSLKNPGAPEEFVNPAVFLLEISGKAMRYRDAYSRDFHNFWYLDKDSKKIAQTFINKLISEVTKKKNAILAQKNFSEIFQTIANSLKLEKFKAENYFAVSKLFTTSPFGEKGLISWPEINPRTARDWAYLVLKRENKPMHFSELSKSIGSLRKLKRTNLQTVHNELIKDNRFVLVGRGMYGLKENGLLPGTAKEVISYILKNNGPMGPKEIISKVKEQRMFKDGTILINLQNRNYFKNLPDGRYFLS